MKNTSKILFLFISFVIASVSFGQNYEENKNKLSIESFESEPSELNFISAKNFQVVPVKNISNCNVFINQIGIDNEVLVKTQSINNDIVLNQNGTQNKIYLDVIADNVEESISQLGNYNYVLDYSTLGAELHSLEVLQTGNNQSLTWFGGNSISENLKVNMQGESKTIIVRNFN